MDGVDRACAPGRGRPEVGGLTSHDAQRLVRGLAGLNLVGGDVVQVSPLYDGPGQITAVLATNLMFEFLSALANLGEVNRADGGTGFTNGHTEQLSKRDCSFITCKRPSDVDSQQLR